MNGLVPRCMRLLFAPLWLATLSSATLAAEPSPLWQGARFGACSLELHFEQGSLEVEPGRGRPRLEGPAASWQVEEVRDEDGHRRLHLKTPPSSEENMSAPLRLALPARCAARLITTHGNVTAVAPPRAGLQAESVTGNLTLFLPHDGDYSVMAATSGDLTVDFDLELDYLRHAEPAKRGRLRLGAGTTGVTLESKRGAVRVLEARRRSAQIVTDKTP